MWGVVRVRVSEGGGWVGNIVVMDVAVRGGEGVVLVVMVGGVIGIRVGGGVATEVLGGLMVERSRPCL